MSLCECGCGQTVENAPYTDKARGWVKGEPKRFIRYHHMRVDEFKPKKGKRIKNICIICEKEFEVIPAKAHQKLCSNPCRNKHKSINQLAPDGNIQKTSSGYYMIKMKDHPQADKKGYVHYHRYMLEKHLGYVLPKKYHVHHIDENKENNNVSNLVAIDRKAHAYLHFVLREKDERGRLV